MDQNPRVLVTLEDNINRPFYPLLHVNFMIDVVDISMYSISKRFIEVAKTKVVMIKGLFPKTKPQAINKSSN